MSKALEIGLHAAIVAVEKEVPLVLTVEGTDKLSGLPFGPFRPLKHRTLENGLRSWVEAQTRLHLGYVEQLYTFGDAGRMGGAEDRDSNLVSIGYLALVPRPETPRESGLVWHSWYNYFPWEDWRDGPPVLLIDGLLPALVEWASQVPEERAARLRLAFGYSLKRSENPTTETWDEERVLERYELMYEAGLVEEAVRDGQATSLRTLTRFGQPMRHDHRRILATAIARLRGKLKYRPVVFELLPESFTLTELQHTVETLSGQRVHKQNFRRMVEKAELVEPTGATAVQTGGRPAAYFRFRRSVTRERPASGLKVGSR